MRANPLPDGHYRCRVFADSEPVLRERRGGRWFVPGATDPIRVANNFREPDFADRLYAEILPAEGGPV